MMYQLKPHTASTDLFEVYLSGIDAEGDKEDIRTECSLFTPDEFVARLDYLKTLKTLMGIPGAYEANTNALQQQFGEFVIDLSIPQGEYGEVNTLISMEIQMISSEGVLYQVELSEEGC